MKKTLLTAAFITLCLVSIAQVVPSRFNFAGVDLHLSDQARKEIQTDVDALTRYPKYFNIKLNRAKLYFPVIEEIFAREEVPDDFKFLVLQESALIADAVSTSNAVGFWQFKKGTAEEVGLRVDGNVDERLNIVSSTYGAAKYLKTNHFYFRNWVYALLAYNTGRGGVERYIEQKYIGARRMEIDKQTHWYVKKFLAHKIAFESALVGPSLNRRLIKYTNGANKNLEQISSEIALPYDTVKTYNKWLKRGRIPEDKLYTLIVPIEGNRQPAMIARQEHENEQILGTVGRERSQHDEIDFDDQSDQFPVLENFRGDHRRFVDINGKPGIVADANESVMDLAKAGDLNFEKFLAFNDLDQNEKVKKGTIFYLKRKRNKAKVHFHTVKPDESLWEISQKYGIKLRKILQKNRMSAGEKPEPGRVLWLRFIRPANQPIEYKQVNKLQSTPSVPAVARSGRKEVVRNYDQIALRESESQKDNTTSTYETASNQPEIKEPSLNIQMEEKPQGNKKNSEKVLQQDTEKKPTQNKANESLSTPKNESNVQPKEAESKNKEEFEIPDNFEFVEADGRVAESNLHVVAPGETLYGISRRYSVTVEDLIKWNKLSVASSIKPGQQLVINHISQPDPGKSRQSPNKTYTNHIVQPGETLYQIARQYKVSIKELMDLNNKNDFNLSVGESLKVRTE